MEKKTLMENYIDLAASNNLKLAITLKGNVVYGKPYTSDHSDKFQQQLKEISNDIQANLKSPIGFNLKDVTLVSGGNSTTLPHLFIFVDDITAVTLVE